MNPQTADPTGDDRGDTRTGGRSLQRNAFWLMFNTLVSGALGLLFWVVAARLFPPAAVATEGSLITVLIAVSSMGQLNLASALVRFLPLAGSRMRRVVIGSYAAAFLASAVLGILAVFVLGGVSDVFATVWESPWRTAMFVAGVMCWSIFALQDAVLMSFRAAGWIAAENTAFGVLKIVALLPIAAAALPLGIVLAWVLPMVLLLIPVNVYVWRRTAHLGSVQVESDVLRSLGRRGLVRFLGLDYGAALASQAATASFPLMAVQVVGAADAASLYLPFLLITTVDTLTLNWTTSFIVEAAHDERSARLLAKQTAKRISIMLGTGIGATLLLAPLVLAVFGGTYSGSATTPLRILILACAFRAMILLFEAICRLQGRGWLILLPQLAVLVLLTVLAPPMGTAMGTGGVALGWLLANALTGLAVVPFLVRALRTEVFWQARATSRMARGMT